MNIAYQQIGEIATANVRNNLENHKSQGKPRPVILIQRTNGLWKTMGLTRQSKYASGSPRVAVPHPARIGLTAPCNFWGDRLTNVSAIDLGHHIGWIDLTTILALETLIDLPAVIWKQLRQVANEHHGEDAA
jgi:hypothetical protein